MNTIKSLNFGNVTVSFSKDGFLNATQIAKQFDKRINNYLRSEQTQQYIEALYQNLKARNSAMDKNQLVIVQKGGNVHFSGTWLHPKLAVDFARWLDPKFAVWCDEQIEHIISGSPPLQQPQLPAEYFAHLAKMAHYAEDYQKIQSLLCTDPYSEQAQKLMTSFNYSTNSNQTGYLFVFKPNIQQDVKQAFDFLYQYSQKL